MTTKEIQTRIEKKEKDIEKINKRIAKWENNRDSEKVFVKEYGWLNTFEERKDEFKQMFVDNCNSEIRRAKNDLAEATATLEKYKSQLAKIETFNSTEKIPVIWEFLQNWKKEAYQYYLDNAKLYSELFNKANEAWEEYRNSKEVQDNMAAIRSEDKNWFWASLRQKFKTRYYAPITTLTKDITTNRATGTVDTERLNKILDTDVQHKYNDFIARITEKAGNIIDVSYLSIANNGIINGTVIGDKAKVYVETITAGGYNNDVIVNVKHGQILHYRVLVKVIGK